MEQPLVAPARGPSWLRERRRVGSVRAGWALLAAVAVLGYSRRGSPPPAARVATALETPPVRQDSRVQTNGYSQFSLNLTSCAAVRKWMREKHVGEDSLPKSVDIFVDADQIEGSMGAQASSGYFAFSLARGDFLSGHINTSFVIVMDLLGNLQNVLIPPETTQDNITGYFRIEGLKFHNATALLLASNSRTIDHYFVWDWVNDAVEMLGDGVSGSSHDVQHLPDTDTYLSISSDFTYLIEWDARGRVVWNWTAPQWLTTASVSGTHMNHAQQTEGDVIFVSARDLSSVFKVDKQSSSIEWVLGGKRGDFDIIDQNGDRYPRNTVFFHRQHNAEYIGHDQFIMFDNGVNVTADPVYSSRLLVLTVNQSSDTATVSWQFDTYANSRIFGDADRLPSGNVVACYWPDTVFPNSKWERAQYEAVAIEVTESRDVAWWMGVKPHHEAWMGDSESYARHDGEAPIGWAMYSVERMFQRPLVTNLQYDAAEQTLSFDMYNSHKEQFYAQATLDIKCGAVSLVHHADFAPFWRPASVTKSISDLIEADRDVEDCTLQVTNGWGQSATSGFSISS